MIFAAFDKAQAEEIAVSRLAAPQMIDNYKDYYRRALYVEMLGEIGTTKALPILKKLSEGNSLEKDWDEYLKEDASKAIEKIKIRENPAAGLIPAFRKDKTFRLFKRKIKERFSFGVSLKKWQCLKQEKFFLSPAAFWSFSF